VTIGGIDVEAQRKSRDGRQKMVAAASPFGAMGGSFFFLKVIVDALPPFTTVLGRVGLAAIALNLFLLAKGDRMPSTGRLWRQFFVMGLLNNVIPFTLIAFGETALRAGWRPF
jgi:drug/metabolite transporter (DMT)-like permease